jgi:replicative DNA helicase
MDKTLTEGQQVKLPPHSMDAEESVLGSRIVDSNHWDAVKAIVQGKDFYREKNRWVFESMERVAAKGIQMNQITLAEDLASRNEGKNNINILEAIGGRA